MDFSINLIKSLLYWHGIVHYIQTTSSRIYMYLIYLYNDFKEINVHTYIVQ